MRILSLILKIAKYSFISITSVSLISIVTVSLLLFTHTGNQAILSTTQKFEPRLSIELIEGSLFHSPYYENIAWVDGETRIEIQHLDYEFEWQCLFSGICLQSLNLDGATIILPEPIAEVEAEIETESGPLVIDLPVDINIENINLSNVHFKMGELGVDLDKLDLQADATGKDITLSSQITNLLVTLPDTEKPKIESAKVAPSAPKKKMDLNLSSLPAILTEGMLPTVILPVNLTIKPIIINQFKLLQNDASLFELNHLETAFTFKQSQLSITEFTLDIPETVLTLNADIDFIDHYPLNVNIEGKIKSIKQLQPETLLEQVSYQFSSNGSLSDLNSELKLSNKVNLQLKTHLNLFAENLPHSIKLDWQSLNWPLTSDPQFQSKQGSFSSQGSLVDHRITLDTQYAITDIPEGKVSLLTKGNLEQLQVESLNVETLAGNIDFSGLLTWKDGIDWLGELKITGIDLKEFETAYDGQFSGLIKQQVAVTLYENSEPEWQFDFPQLDINGELLTRPLTISGRISGNNQQGISFDKLAINNAENTFVIDGVVAEENNLNVKLSILDLSHAVLGTNGAISGNIKLQGPQNALRIKSKLSAQDLRYESYLLEKLTLDSKVTLTAKPQVVLEMNATALSIDKQKIDKLKLNVNNKSIDNDNFRHKIELLVNSEIISTDLLLYLSQTDDELLTELNEAKLMLPHQTLTLVKPFQVIQQENNISLTDHCWQANADNVNKLGQHKAGKLCIDEFNVGDSGRVVFNINNYLLSNLNPFLPDEFKMAGALSADADIKWADKNNPDFSINLFSEDMLLKINNDPKTQNFTDYPMKTFTINALGKKKQVAINANIFSDGLIDVKIAGKVAPYKNVPSIDTIADINIPDFSLFLPLIPQLERLSGSLNSHLTIAGKLENPTVNGNINVENGTISSPTLPIKISELQTVVNIANTQATVSGSFSSNDTNTIGEKTADIPLLTNTLNIFDKSVKKVSSKIINQDTKQIREDAKLEATPGLAHIKGQFDWSKKLKGDLHFYAHKLEIYDYGKIDILASPNIKMHLNEHFSVKGELFIDKGKVVVKELPAGAVSQSKDIIVIDVEKESIAPDLPIMIDLSLDMGNDFQLVALGLDSFIEGKLLIKKQLEKDLTINGQLNFVDGSYRALGQQLVLRKSRVIFQGSPESPYLTIEAIRDPDKIEDSVIAGVRVTGTPDELELQIFSEPAMSQQEALSYLTRGQSLDSSSDSSTMANMLIDIAAGQSDGLMSSIGEEVGIKDLSLSSSGTGDEQSVGVRGEIAPGVEISYGVGVFDSFSIFALRYEMFERFYLEASSGIYQAVDAYYEWDWD